MKYRAQDLKNIKVEKISVWLKISAVVVFTALLIWSVILVRDKMLKNASDMGMYLTQSYAWEEENRIEMYSVLLSMCSQYTNDAIDNNLDNSTISDLLKDYLEKATTTIDYSILDPYAVIDGEIVAAKPWEGDAGYEYEKTEWYQKAIEADGQIIYTNIYKDVITNKNMVTLAVKLHGENNVLAFDIIIEKFYANSNHAVMPERSSYMLFGADDRLIYATGIVTEYEDGMEQYTDDVVKKIRSGQMKKHDSTIVGLDGYSRTVYYYEMSNGWLSVVTIPVSQILQDGWNDAVVGLAMICVLIIGCIIIFMIRDYIVNQNVRYNMDTLKLLGDSYYEIYRLDYKTAMYRAIKVPDDIKKEQQEAENYLQLIQVIKSKIDESYVEQFERDFSIENIRELILNGVFEIEREYKRKFGNTYKWISAQAVYKQSLKINEVIICFKEIDNQKKYELNQTVLLKNALDTAQDNVKQKTRFFSEVSHDMRTPLSTIIGLSKLAQAKKEDRQKVDEYVCKIQTAGEQMLSIVNNVLEFSRIESNQNLLNYVPIDINKCIRDSLKSFDSKITEQNKTLNFISDISRPYVYGDAIKLAQIINNIVNNAIKRTRENDTITVSLNESNISGEFIKYIINIEDNGTGMSQESIKNIFEPFSNSQDNDNKELSLPIVKMLVDQMNGQIYVNSSINTGSKFTIVLSMKLSDENEIEKQQVNNKKKIQQLKNKYVLIAEDNELDKDYLTKSLESFGMNVIYAKNGREAVDMYTKYYEKISVIIMDLKMPVLDGFSASREVRDLPISTAKTVPIIAGTANIFDDDITRMSASGINTYITKPISFNQLKQVILDYVVNKNI